MRARTDGVHTKNLVCDSTQTIELSSGARRLVSLYDIQRYARAMYRCSVRTLGSCSRPPRHAPDTKVERGAPDVCSVPAGRASRTRRSTTHAEMHETKAYNANNRWWHAHTHTRRPKGTEGHRGAHTLRDPGCVGFHICHFCVALCVTGGVSRLFRHESGVRRHKGWTG